MLIRGLMTISVLLAALIAVGCDGQVKTPPTGDAKTANHKSKTHEHAHSSIGPHKGGVIELGDDEYHAEFVHDETTCDVTIYILDSAAKSAVPIDAADVVINLKHDGKPEQHVLAAEPQEGDGAGKSSRFVSKKNSELCHAIEEEGAEARLRVIIAGKSYTGKIAHHHDHSDGKHGHEKVAHEGHDHEGTR